MKTLWTVIILSCLSLSAYTQTTFTAIVRSAEDLKPLAGATILWKKEKKSAVADSNGVVTLNNIPDGDQSFELSFIGYASKTVSFQLPVSSSENVYIDLEPEETEEEEEVVVTATRLSRTIPNLPTRVEVISGEELVEKGNMKPGDIRMLLNESTGIQTQQTSATSFNASIRIQGLDGRYTQLLKDGYPLYSGFSGGLSILQIAPLDLKQVEVVKGSASTLYGGGAIAGLVNLVSKTPGDKSELNFLVNGTSAGGLDLSGFYSQRFKKIGVSVFGSRNSNRPFDPADIGFTAIPKFERYTINPRIFYYGKKTTADIGVTYIAENRLGGSMAYIKDDVPGFFERNKTDRITTQFGLAHKLGEHTQLQLKTSYSRFDRSINIPQSFFEALQQSSFSELTVTKKGERADWVIGASAVTEDLAEKSVTSIPKRDYHLNTFGLFIQNALSISEKFILETGLRADYINDYGVEVLPRLSAMIKLSPALTTRIGGGFGYKTPTIFTEEAERIQFRNVYPINSGINKNERSVGFNWDFNYRTHIDQLGISFNHLFFFTRINRPLVLVNEPNSDRVFQNSTGHLDTKGMETNLRLTYGDFKLFVGYTYTDANTHYNSQKEWLPLTARHRLNNVLMYEVEEKWKLGLEAYYFSRQQLNDGSFGRDYWIMGFMAEKLWEKLSLFINFENFTGTRQTKFGSIYSGPLNNPIFQDIYAPVEGFVVNGGIKLFLGK